MENVKKLPSKEAVWKKYYVDSSTEVKNDKTVYEALVENNKNRKNLLAIEYFGTKMTYGQLFDKIDDTAKAFSNYGIDEGDFVTICTPGMPETVFSFYALSKIGAVANMISPTFDHEQLIKRIEECNSNLLVIMDSFYEKLKDTISKSNIKDIVVVPTMNSSLLRFISKKYSIDRDNGEMYWNDFISNGKCIKDVKPCVYRENQPVAMVYSSGTTGASKGILLSNDSFLNSVEAYRKTGIDLSAGQKLYQIVPTWFSTGLSTSVNLPLVSGISIFMDPRFEQKQFVTNVFKHKPNYTIATTNLYEGFLNKKYLKKDLSFLHYPFAGGEALPDSQQKKITEQFKKLGSPADLLRGYGQCECGAGVTTEVAGVEHPKNSVGIPMTGVKIGIFDNDRNELAYNQYGEILACTPCSMIEYYNNPEANDKYFYYDSDGNRWCCTGDAGHIDENGNLFVDGRISLIKAEFGDDCDLNQAITIKKKLEEIGNMINTDLNITGSILTRGLDENGEQTISLHIIPTEDFKEQILQNPENLYSKLEEFQTKIYEKYGDLSLVPTKFKLRKEFPVAASGKRDFKALLKETEGFENINFNLEKGKKLIKNKKDF